ncbi:MAG: tRNA dimethylallyltransferase [Parcubacteria group bacterium Gr01-1014_48]|nr:MAG: tRNA dimethylallyltransferase [Parcubacteria group bacterium Greene0416_14]TSC74553.1 MAG: tRNA dimethylallyltransferase [Parcubacteria group bacterium Gr01-1014_48]TSD01429.1 MAG: tRNA dimethylallyltransferase [Parcubacteria group bacterium Greene1014_15]TSD08429.1 MAG: tRNA dimethylallyltransferase [Parcubacteria group bacterium Greene0714_4]
MIPQNNKIKVLAIVGPTATGKSDLAVLLARKYNGEVISADSRQVYRGLDIGSGKITKKEMRGIPHHMIDIADPKRTYTVAQYQKKARKELYSIVKRKRLPIICGGSGFYVQAIIDNLEFPNVPPNKKLRLQLAQQSPEELYVALSSLDPKRAAVIDKHNSRRLVRALEIVNIQGCVPKQKQQESRFNVCSIGITFPKDILHERIRIRLKKRFKKGMVREVACLHEYGISWKQLESFGLEYRFIAEYLQKKMTLEEMKEKLEQAIRQFAKRQMTWFKRDTHIRWFDHEQQKEISARVWKFLSR